MTHHIGRQPRRHHTTYNILAFLLLAIVYLTAAVPSMAATLLPNGKQTFLLSNGNPIAAGKVFFYIPGTSTPKNTYQDEAATIPNSNPVDLDAAGRAIIYGIGCYRQVVQTSAGVPQWDELTCDTSSTEASWGGTAGGTPNAITVAADNFTGADGQVIRFIAAANNSGATTVNPSVAGVPFGAVAVMVDGGSGPTACTGGEVIQDNVITLVYDANSGVFHLSTLTTITAGAGLSASGVGSSGGTLAVSGTLTSVQPVNSQTGTTYTVLSTDNAKLISFSNSSSVAVTLPAATGSFGAGFWFDTVNIGGGAVTITPASGTINGASSLTITSSNHGRIVSNGTNWLFAGSGGTSAVSNATTGYRNLLIVNNSGTENTQIAITADYLSLTNASGFSFAVQSVSVVCNYGVNGVNGLDTGSFTLNTWYHHWIISNGTTTACLGSTSASSPTMPSGYTFKMRVGANKTNASTQFLRVRQTNDTAQYRIQTGSNTVLIPILITGVTGTYSATSPTLTATSLAAVVPPTATQVAFVANNTYTNLSTSRFLLAPTVDYGGTNNGPAGSNGLIWPVAETSVTGPPGMTPSWIALEAYSIAHASDGAGFALGVMAWKDNI